MGADTATIQNKGAEVENLEIVNIVKNKVAKKATQTIFERVIGLDNLTNIVNDIVIDVISSLRNASFMTEELELSERQAKKLKEVLQTTASRVRENYRTELDKNKRTRETVEIVTGSCTRIIEETLSLIAQEKNRGAILNATARAADTKNNDYNKIELHYSKFSGDITIPTRGIFISTNCVDLILNSIEVVAVYELKKEKNEEASTSSGEMPE